MFIATVTNVQVINDVGFTNQYVTPLLPYFEIFYCLCTLGLLVVAIIGLRQFVLTRRIAKAASKRDALKISAEQCRFYGEKIIPLAQKLLSKIDVDVFKESFSVSVEKRKIHVTKIKDIPKENMDDFSAAFKDFAALFNAIESFSQCLTSGLADEKMPTCAWAMLIYIRLNHLFQFWSKRRNKGTCGVILLTFLLFGTTGSNLMRPKGSSDFCVMPLLYLKKKRWHTSITELIF